MNRRIASLFVAFVGVSAVFQTTGVFAETCTCPGQESGVEPCCTYTIGRWSTWNIGAKQPHKQVPWPTNCADAPFDGSGPSEGVEVFPDWKALEIIEEPSNNGWCWILGQQYVAASMNKCQGACVDDTVSQALAAAYGLLTANCPNGTWNLVDSSLAENIKNVLDNYNNGINYGPGHCGSEEPPECPTYECEGGCTRTQGYWKTHSAGFSKGKKADEWANYAEGTCPHGETDILFGAVTKLDALTTPPANGDACLIAAKQYVAFILNRDCLGSCVPGVVGEAVQCVESILFNTDYCPDKLFSNPDTDELNAVRSQLLMCSSKLDAYNNGFLLGPGSCDYLAELGLAVSAVAEPEGEALTPQSAMIALPTGIAIAILVFAVLSCVMIAWIANQIRTYRYNRVGGFGSRRR